MLYIRVSVGTFGRSHTAIFVYCSEQQTALSHCTASNWELLPSFL